ncbi:uncharacterized protein LOC111632939 [Centruroides sculpturatus]|uniref:uncharacterized protein LOC111632939 n=1 Tax=Centruroides sculpturatus TaxID=218467 RepID=UPI000C6E2A51|nr:uncharacterized protein LOC111632939 [Centruroides sculpturatus]
MATVSKTCRNFSEEEKNVLTEVIKNYPVVEEKGYDNRTLAAKKTAWEKIQVEFSSSFPRRAARTIEQLKGCWKRLKIDAKKEADNNRYAAHITGGGPALSSLNPATQVVSSVLGDGIEPLSNPDDPPSPLIIKCENNTEILTATNECSNSGLFSPVMVSDAAVKKNMEVADDPSSTKGKLINSSLEKVQILLMESIKTEKMKQDTEKKKQEAEQLRIEVLKLKKLKLLKELGLS